MSTIRLLKDHTRGKAGEFVSVPFGIGRELIAAGHGEYTHSALPDTLPPRETVNDAAIRKIQDEALATMQSQDAAHAAAMADLKKTHDVALTDLADARKQLATVTAERDELAKKLHPKK